MAKLALHHLAWLTDHPHRTERWLRARLADGFDVHHLDRNCQNNDPLNLVLIEAADHTKNIHGLPFTRTDAILALKERAAQLDAAFDVAMMVRGAYISKTIKGKLYWYFQDTKTRTQHYIGPDFAYLRTVISGYNEEKGKIEAEFA